MHRGRINRSAIPYTASEDNWFGNARGGLPFRYWVNDLTYQFGLGVQGPGQLMSDPVARPFGILSFQYHFRWKIGLINFTGDFLIEPTPTAPSWDIGLIIQSGGFGTLTATYRTKFIQIAPQAKLDYTMVDLLSIMATGSFRTAFPTWILFAVSYHEEP
jgi:hypothetical protein